MTDHQSDNPSQSLHPKYFEEDPMSYTDILLILARQIKVILIVPTILCTFTIIYVQFIAVPVYTSTSKIMSSSGGGGMSKTAGLASQFGITIPTDQSNAQWVYKEIIKSRTLAKSMLKQKFDTQKFGKQKPLIQILTYGNTEPDINSMYKFEIKAMDAFISMINLSENSITRVYTLSINAFEDQFAYDLNNTLIEELDSHQREYNKTKTSEARQFIDERIIEIEKELITAEESLKNFMDRNRRIENSPTLQLDKQRLFREVTVLTGVFTTLKQQLETTKIEEVKDSDYVIVLDRPEVPIEYNEPKKKRMVILAGLLGIGFGILIGLIREYAEKNTEKEKLGQAKLLVYNHINEIYLTLRKFLKLR